MELSKYRKYIVNVNDNNNEYNFFNPEWESVNMKVPHWTQSSFTRSWDHNHQLINSGKAYWVDQTTLCLGYKLINNPVIYRPIFSHKRQKIINKFQKNISKVVLKREKYLIYMELLNETSIIMRTSPFSSSTRCSKSW